VARRLREVCRHVVRAKRGAVVLEFAVAAMAFLGATAFVADLGFVLYTQVALDFVAARAARLLAVDSQQTLSANPTAFQAAAVCPLLANFLACDQITVGLTSVTDYANGSIPTAGPTPFNPGQGGSLMLLQLTYALPTFAAPLAMGGVFGATQTIARFPYVNEY
jgi:Flp pilus assembly protein TadG